ncbi:MAG: Na+/H+ antiporter NhaC family protein [Planctomycetota bacterium]
MPPPLFAEAHPYGVWSLVPPLVSIVLAIATRRVVPSLLAGVIAGVLIVEKFQVAAAIPALFEQHLWKSLADPQHLRVFVFTLLMGAMVSVIHASGGMRGLVRSLAPLARNRRGGQLISWLLGLVIFFDDYANCLLLGNTLRPLTDRLRISREKLSFLVDSTAAPVSGLAVVSTWVATEIGLIEAGYRDVLGEAVPLDGMGIFIATIPYRYYVLFMLAWIPFLALLNRDFGPMLAAERAALAGRSRVAHPMPMTDSGSGASGVARHWAYAALPVFAMVLCTGWLLIATGAQTLKANAWDSGRWVEYFRAGDSYVALVYASLIGLSLAWLVPWATRALDAATARVAAFNGATHVIGALTILWLAWCLSELTKDQHLATGKYLAELLSDRLSPPLMPTVVFVLSALISFATGTSWGTMGIMMPIVIPVTFRMLAGSAGIAAVDIHDPIIIAAIGSVLAGSIFGDHCSPISDTTVLSSQSSACDHVAHVWTQLPYAALVGVGAILFGTLPAGYGVPNIVLLPVGLLALVIFLYVVGRRVDAGIATSANSSDALEPAKISG